MSEVNEIDDCRKYISLIIESNGYNDDKSINIEIEEYWELQIIDNNNIEIKHLGGGEKDILDKFEALDDTIEDSLNNIFDEHVVKYEKYDNVIIANVSDNINELAEKLANNKLLLKVVLNINNELISFIKENDENENQKYLKNIIKKNYLKMKMDGGCNNNNNKLKRKELNKMSINELKELHKSNGIKMNSCRTVNALINNYIKNYK